MLEIENAREQKQGVLSLGVLMGVLAIPVAAVGACLAVPYIFALRWTRQWRERKLRVQMRAAGRLISWVDFLRSMRDVGGSCIEEKFSPKGPVRFWWTPEDLGRESPYAIIDWFTMHKGRQHEPFILWCRQRYTSAESGSAVLVDATMVPRREIYTLWAECRSGAKRGHWVEVAPPEILPRRSGQ